MKWVKYIIGIVIIFVAVAILFSGAVSTFENILELNVVGIIAGILTIAIGLFLGRIGLKLFRHEEFRWLFTRRQK